MMKQIKLLFAFMFIFFPMVLYSQNSLENLPLPSPAQLRWQNYEQIMFVHFGPAAWQNREYDNWSTPLEQIHLPEINTDQWCEVALSWGAKMVLFVAKHCGGFCWWQTETSEYGVRNIPWKNGKGDVLKDLSESCKKYGLDLGIYIYPGDEHWGAGIGSGGLTEDPSKQEAYNKIYRQQLIEVLTRYGTIHEVWFDGNCHVPVEDILDQYASDAVIFQGKSANIRWVGNEDGIAPDPNWYTLSCTDMRTGVATALHSDVNGDCYAPVEVDVPFLKNGGHKWFWAPDTDHLLMSMEQLMNLYYKSVGRGSVLLLNSTPDTTGLIPDSHVVLYKAFGEEISSRFQTPLKKTSGTGNALTITFSKPTIINHIILQEDLSKGQRVTQYILEGSLNGNDWKPLYKGTSVGNKKIDYFPDAAVREVRVRFIQTKASPIITNFAVYKVESDLGKGQNKETPITIGSWDASTFEQNEWKEIILDLTPYVNQIGQYEIYFNIVTHDFNDSAANGLDFKDWSIEMYGKVQPEGIEKIEGKSGFRITRSQQTLDEYSTRLRIWVKRKPGRSSGEITLSRLTY